MGAVAERLDLTVAEVKQWLQIGDEDEEVKLLETLIESAKEAADQYMNNPFVDDEGRDVPIPTAVKLWCLRRISRDYERRTEGIAIQSDDVGSVHWEGDDWDGLQQYRRNPGW